MKNVRLEEIYNNFETKNNVTKYNSEDNFYDTIRELHDGVLPNNFMFDLIHSAVSSLTGYDLDNEDHNEVITDIVNGSFFNTNEFIEHFKLYPHYAENRVREIGDSDIPISEYLMEGLLDHYQEIIGTIIDKI